MPSVRVKLIITDEIAELRNKEESQDFQEETAPTQSITRPKRLRNPLDWRLMLARNTMVSFREGGVIVELYQLE